MEVAIKELKANDKPIIDQLVKIEREAFAEGGLNYWGLIPMIYHGLVYAILIDNKPVGLLEYMRDMENPTKAYLYGLSISSDYQNCGYGTRLLDYSLQQIRKKDISKVELTVDPNNKRALHFYQDKFGFKKIGFRENEYGAGEDRLIMEAIL